MPVTITFEIRYAMWIYQQTVYSKQIDQDLSAWTAGLPAEVIIELEQMGPNIYMQMPSFNVFRRRVQRKKLRRHMRRSLQPTSFALWEMRPSDDLDKSAGPFLQVIFWFRTAYIWVCTYLLISSRHLSHQHVISIIAFIKAGHVRVKFLKNWADRT